MFELFHANFLWLSNGLGAHDPLYILPVLAGITQWVQSRMMLTRSVDPQQQMMNNLMNFMPLMIVFFALRYASGLSLYWVTSTLIGIAIQYKITGLGLLPETLRGWAGILGGSGHKADRWLRKTVGASRASSRAAQSRSLTGQNGDAQRKDSAPRPSANGQSNGSGGADEVPRETAAVVRPRKKANRARGGRGGGRRG